MEGESLPPLYPEEPPQGEPVQYGHEELAQAAEAVDNALDWIDGYIAQAVEDGGFTAEQAAAHRSKAVASFSQILQAMALGQHVPDPDAAEKFRLGRIEFHLGELDVFERRSRAKVASGEWTEEEVPLRRAELIERHTRALDQLEE